MATKLDMNRLLLRSLVDTDTLNVPQKSPEAMFPVEQRLPIETRVGAPPGYRRKHLTRCRWILYPLRMIVIVD